MRCKSEMGSKSDAMVGLLVCLVSIIIYFNFFFFFSSRRRHTRCGRDWSSDVCSSDLWPDIVYNIIPADFLYVKIRRISTEKREITLKAEGERSLRLIERVGKYVSKIGRASCRERV